MITTGTVLEVENVVSPDRMASEVSNMWITDNMLRQNQINDWNEVRRYVYATDTTATSNSSLPWKNKTTIPKLCQIRDNLNSNYTATLFPNRAPVEWEANERAADSRAKRDAIKNYMQWVMEQASFKNEMGKVILDYIDYGNCFVTVDWLDQTVDTGNGIQSGYVGPTVRRISPLDIVMNPTAASFQTAPKVIRSLISFGELKGMLEKMTGDENREEYDALWNYLKDIRGQAQNYMGDWSQKDDLYQIDGFTSFRDYLKSDTVEVLTFYGDIYDHEKDEFLKNHVLTIVDRHKLIGKKPNPSFFGYPPIFHAAWRQKPDNIWGMGPLANLVGMQYRVDHIENMRADVWDLVTYPVVKVKGFVEAFNWQPGETIYVSEEGDVDLVQPNVQIMQAENAIGFYLQMMEEMAGAPKEAMGFRSPGEKTKYEVQALENAASRVFQNKIKQFEEQIVEPLLNAMLELARRNLTGVTTIKVFDNDLNAASFKSLSVEDITGIGRIRPVAARHFAEQAQLVQNLTSLAGSQLWPVVQPHFSSVKLAKLFEKVFQIENEEIVLPFVQLSEQAEGQRFAQAMQENVLQATQTASGIGEDFDMQPSPQQMAQQPQGQQ